MHVVNVKENNHVMVWCVFDVGRYTRTLVQGLKSIISQTKLSFKAKYQATSGRKEAIS
jgi:hypothetical protein